MIAMTGWAMVLNLKKFYATQNWILVIIGGIIFLLEIWMIIEAFLLVKKPSTPEKAVA